jgi:hypothetical protein
MVILLSEIKGAAGFGQLRSALTQSRVSAAGDGNWRAGDPRSDLQATREDPRSDLQATEAADVAVIVGRALPDVRD